MKLNVGCADVLLPGWTNIDINPRPDVMQHDARSRFPLNDSSVSFIFSEHFIEHLNEQDGKNFFKDCFRMLKPGGVVRTSTFDIDDIMINCHSEEKWGTYKMWLYGGMFAHMTRVQFFNLAVHEGGNHKYMYNPDEIIRFLREAGFTQFNIPQMKESTFPELQNLEYRCNSNCIVEAIK